MFRKTKLPPIFLYLLLVFLGIFLLGLTGIFRPLTRLVEKRAVIPLRQKIYDWQRLRKKDLRGCQITNESEIDQLKAKIVSLEEENKEQKRLLSAPLPKNWQFLTARVIGSDNETLTINKGRRDGVKENQICLSGNLYLGKVYEVSENMAKIKLPTFSDERLLVKIADGKNSGTVGKGLLTGKGLGVMKIEQILVKENIGSGNLVLANVEGGDLLVGKVEEVVKQKDEVFKTATVKRLFNPEELETVFLIRGRL